MDSDTKTNIQKLNAAWKEQVTKALGLGSSFKLAQGSLGLQTTDSSGLFQMADAIPPNTDLYDASSVSTFSGGYKMLLQALLAEQGKDLAAYLGDNYINWITYRNNYFNANPNSEESQETVFKRFANQRLDPQSVPGALSAYQKQAQSPLNIALDAVRKASNYQQFTSTSGQVTTLPVYAPTLANAKIQVNEGGGPFTIDFDSTEAQKTLTQAQINGAASGFWNIFKGGVQGSFDKLNTKAATSGFSIKGRINKMATLSVTRGNWYSDGEYKRGFNAKGDASVWDSQSNAGGWDTFFKLPDGALARRVSQLVLVSDYEFTVTSNATYSQEEYQQIKTSATFGIWPFFSGSASTTHTTDVKQSSSGHLVTTYKLDKGLFEIWGATVQDAPN
ncbi:hypothetical protein [Comamonas thiooxydans]|uniref:hypothetical protein n=1 Tax=Comamonas thiooxydans TaxID=363952 RepID=UPI0005102797|nr:hypothetical protein [Comamonas thiooxydans]KGG87818.1 hypothetical protein P609_06905 [Comamonas thiooxydans]